MLLLLSSSKTFIFNLIAVYWLMAFSYFLDVHKTVAVLFVVVCNLVNLDPT